MKNLTLIIVCALFCISASVVSKNFVVSEPKKPIHSVVYDGEDPSAFYLKYANMGYVVSNVARGGYNKTFIVMSKY